MLNFREKLPIDSDKISEGIFLRPFQQAVEKFTGFEF
jgi:hypothetical protein